METREVTEEDLVKVGVFGFVVARSKESGSIYTLTIVNGDDGADVYDQLTNPTDEIIGLLPAPLGTFACYAADEEIDDALGRTYSPCDDLLYLEYPGEKTSDIKKTIKDHWIEKEVSRQD